MQSISALHCKQISIVYGTNMPKWGHVCAMFVQFYHFVQCPGLTSYTCNITKMANAVCAGLVSMTSYLYMELLVCRVCAMFLPNRRTFTFFTFPKVSWHKTDKKYNNITMAAVFTAQPSPLGNTRRPYRRVLLRRRAPTRRCLSGPITRLHPFFRSSYLWGDGSPPIRQTSWRWVISPSPCHRRRHYCGVLLHRHAPTGRRLHRAIALLRPSFQDPPPPHRLWLAIIITIKMFNEYSCQK